MKDYIGKDKDKIKELEEAGVDRINLSLHSLNDNVISIEDARKTFSLANDPKRFVEFDEEKCIHGYCDPMRKIIEEEFKEIFV